MKKSVQLENDKRLQALRIFLNALGVKNDCQEYGFISGYPYSILNVYDVIPEQENKINSFIDLLY